jgi:hypothetical protein
MVLETYLVGYPCDGNLVNMGEQLFNIADQPTYLCVSLITLKKSTLWLSTLNILGIKSNVRKNVDMILCK